MATMGGATGSAKSSTARGGKKAAAGKKAGAKKAGAPRSDAKSALTGGRARDHEVLETAVRIFWEKGYANSSVQDVADALGMLKGSLYYYIDSKEGLLLKIFEDSHREISEMTDAAAHSSAPAVQRLAEFLHQYAMWTLTHLERAGLYAREWRFVSDEIKRPLSDQQRYYNTLLRELIAAGQKERDLDPDVDPREATRFIWAAFTGLPDWFRPGRARVENVAADYVQFALRVTGSRVEWSRLADATSRVARDT